ncbi:MAG TPA: IclR family transcriptional regulator [Microbacterium sp.]|nr:IclR family transcriptional regulator [Microbacterium sp.]
MARNSLAVLRILEVLGEGDPMGLSDVAGRLLLPKTSVHRALLDLVEEGWVRALPQTPPRYVLSAKVLRVARGANGLTELVSAAAPVMDRLLAVTGENVQLLALEDGHIFALARRESTHALRVHLPMGERMPWHATAAGKAIASRLDDDARERLLSLPLAALTPGTTIDRGELSRQLAKAAIDGVVVNRGGWRTGVVSIGAPILDSDGTPLAGLSINGVESRLSPGEIDPLADLVRDAAREIGERLS